MSQSLWKGLVQSRQCGRGSTNCSLQLNLKALPGRSHGHLFGVLMVKTLQLIFGPACSWATGVREQWDMLFYIRAWGSEPNSALAEVNPCLFLLLPNMAMASVAAASTHRISSARLRCSSSSSSFIFSALSICSCQSRLCSSCSLLCLSPYAL